jgi:hypothetical protein
MNKTAKAILAMMILITGYYSFMVAVLKGWMASWCQKIYCLDFLSFGEYLSISIAIIGLVFVIKSLDGWKEQDKFLNARNICNQLINFQTLCELDLLILIGQKQNEMDLLASLEEQKKLLQKAFFELELFKIDRELGEKLEQSNFLCKNELKDAYKILNKCLHKMYSDIENQENNFKNIQSFLNIAIRNDIKEVSKKLNKINEQLNHQAN